MLARMLCHCFVKNQEVRMRPPCLAGIRATKLDVTTRRIDGEYWKNSTEVRC